MAIHMGGKTLPIVWPYHIDGLWFQYKLYKSGYKLRITKEH